MTTQRQTVRRFRNTPPSRHELFGALRKQGIFAPFKELMAPYQSSDYRDIASGAWREAERRSPSG